MKILKQKMNFLYIFLFITIISADVGVVDFNLNDEPEQINLPQGSDGNEINKDAHKLDFVKAYYIVKEEKQKLKSGYKILFDVQVNQKIKVKGGFKLTDAQKLGMEEYLAVTIDKVKISIDVKSDISKKISKDTRQLIFLLEFIPEEKLDTIRTVLILLLKDTPEKPKKIFFEKSRYKINALPEYTGFIGEFVAKLDKNDGKSVIKYGLETDKENLRNSLELDEQTGILQITKAFTPATYDFKISAKIDSGIQSKIDVSLVIDHIAVCDAESPKFLYSQLVKHVTEGTTGEIFAPTTPTDKCVYRIVYQEPKGDYFQLDEKTGALKMAKEIKRDDELFKNTDEPKFVIKLDVSCDSSVIVIEPNDDPHRDGGNFFSILYNPTHMFLIVMIDKSDNTPIFNTDKIFVGYPKKYDIITQYGPPRVTNVAPFVKDKDTASLKYSIVEESCTFSIDSITGDVYPLSYFNRDDEYSFTVQAIDKNDDKIISKEDKLVVSVKLLTASQMVEIYIIGEKLENINKLLQDYNSKLNADIEIKSLTEAIVPVTHEQRQSNEALNDKKHIHLLRALCYALDKKERTVVKGEIIVDKLKTSSGIFSLRVLENEKAPDSNGSGGFNWFIIILSVVLTIFALCVAVTIFISYAVYIRGRNIRMIMRRRTNVGSSVLTLADTMETPTHRISYSDLRSEGEVIFLRNKPPTTSNIFPTSGVSSFKPSSTPENLSSDKLPEYHDLVIPWTSDTPSSPIITDTPSSPISNNAPVVDATSLPAASEQE